MPQRGPLESQRMSLAIFIKAQAVCLSAEDSGCGISEQDLPHIFDRFFRTDRSRSREVPGSGLGLSISKWIVDAHGGSLQVSSRLGAGSTFTIELPA